MLCVLNRRWSSWSGIDEQKTVMQFREGLKTLWRCSWDDAEGRTWMTPASSQVFINGQIKMQMLWSRGVSTEHLHWSDFALRSSSVCMQHMVCSAKQTRLRMNSATVCCYLHARCVQKCKVLLFCVISVWICECLSTYAIGIYIVALVLSVFLFMYNTFLMVLYKAWPLISVRVWRCECPCACRIRCINGVTHAPRRVNYWTNE